MNKKLETLLMLVKRIMDDKKSAQVRLNFHQGDLSEKVEIKESIKLDEEEDNEEDDEEGSVLPLMLKL